jgi:hypothetical protein
MSDAKRLPVRSELIDAIDAELREANAHKTRDGFTRWALLAALAALVWMLIDHLGLVKEYTNVITLAFIGFSCVIGLGDVVSNQPLPLALPKKRHFVITDQLAPLRHEMLARLLQCVLVLAAIVTAYGPVSAVVLGFAALRYVFQGAFLGIFLIASYRHKELPTGTLGPVWLGPLSRAITFGGTTIAGAYMLYEAYLLGRVDSLAGLRLGALAAVAVEVLVRIAQTSQDAPRLQALLNLRRELALSDVDDEQAARRFRYMIELRSVESLLADDLEALFFQVDRRSRLVNDIIAGYEATLAEVLPEIPSLSSKSKLLVTQSILASPSLWSELTNVSESAYGQEQRLLARAKKLFALAKDPDGRYQELVHTLERVGMHFQEQLLRANDLKNQLGSVSAMFLPPHE